MKEQHQKHFKSTGQLLLQLREERGLSQQELATLCNVERAKISRIENGRADFMHSTILDIALGMGVDVRRLIAPTPESEPSEFPI